MTDSRVPENLILGIRYPSLTIKIAWKYFEFFIDWGNFTEHARLNGPNHLLKHKMCFLHYKKPQLLCTIKMQSTFERNFVKCFCKKMAIGQMILACDFSICTRITKLKLEKIWTHIFTHFRTCKKLYLFRIKSCNKSIVTKSKMYTESEL